MTTHKKYIIEITYANETYTDDEMVHFANNRRLTLTEVLEYTNNIFKINQADALKKIINHKDFDKDIIQEIKDEYDFDELDNETIEIYELDIIDHLENYTDFNNYLRDWVKVIKNDLEIDTAGYSEWTEYICPKDVSEYASDLWNGHNLYDIDIYDLETKHLYESYGSVHIKPENFNATYLMQELGHDELNLIDNETVDYFEKQDKVKLYKKEWSYNFIEA